MWVGVRWDRAADKSESYSRSAYSYAFSVCCVLCPG